MKLNLKDLIKEPRSSATSRIRGALAAIRHRLLHVVDDVRCGCAKLGARLFHGPQRADKGGQQVTRPAVAESAEREGPADAVHPLTVDQPAPTSIATIVPADPVPPSPQPVPPPTPPPPPSAEPEVSADWMRLAVACGRLMDEMDEKASRLPPEGAQMAELAYERLQDLLIDNGAEEFFDTQFDIRRNIAFPAARVPQGAEIVETIAPGLCKGPRILRRAKVRVRQP